MLWSAFLLGLFSSVHCLGMCGPLQMSFTGAFIRKRKIHHLFLYHLGRVSTYGFLGLLAAFFGQSIGLQSWQQSTSLISGLLLLFALVLFYFLKFDQKLFRLFLPFIHRFRKSLEKHKRISSLYFVGSGALNGLLPCALVYLAILPAMGSNSPGGSLLYMLLFGLGTLPLLLISNIGALRFSQAKGFVWQKITPYLVFLTALLLILRGMELGIPFISPEMPKPGVLVEGCY